MAPGSKETNGLSRTVANPILIDLTATGDQQRALKAWRYSLFIHTACSMAERDSTLACHNSAFIRSVNHRKKEKWSRFPGFPYGLTPDLPIHADKDEKLLFRDTESRYPFPTNITARAPPAIANVAPRESHIIPHLRSIRKRSQHVQAVELTVVYPNFTETLDRRWKWISETFFVVCSS